MAEPTQEIAAAPKARTKDYATTFLLDDPNSVWLVREGRLDIFAIPAGRGMDAGPRRHLWSAPAGSTLFGFDANAGSKFALLAVGGFDTRVQRGRIDKLAARARESSGAVTIARVIDSFVIGLASAVEGWAAPKIHAPMGPNRVETIKDGERVSAANRPVWMQIERGAAEFVDDQALTLEANGVPVPISRGLWLQAAGELEVSTEDTEALLDRDGDRAWVGLTILRRLFLQWVDRRTSAEEEAERTRLRAKGTAESRVRAHGFARLAGVLGESRRRALPGPEADDLMTVLAVIGDAGGLTFKPAPKWESEGTTIDPLGAVCRASRVRHRQVGLRGEWWRHDAGPLLAFTKEERQPLALIPQTGGGYELIDPVRGRTESVNQAVHDRLEQVAYSFYVPFPSEPLGAKDLFRLAFGGLRVEANMVFALALGGALLGLIVPVATEFMFSTVIPSADVNAVIVLIAALAAVHVGQALFQAVRVFALLRLEGKSHAGLQGAMIDRLLGLPVPFFRNYSVGDLSNRAGAINALRDLVSGVAVNSLLSGVFSVVYLGLLFYYSWKLALVAVGILLLGIAVTSTFGARTVRYRRQGQEVEGKISGLVFELIGGIAKLRVSGSEGRGFAQWSAKFAQRKAIAFRAGYFENIIQVFNDVLPLAASAVLFFAVGYLNSKSAQPVLTTGQFVAFNSAFGTFLTSGITLSDTFVQLLVAIPIVERARPILQVIPENTEDQQDPGELTGRIEARHVSFRYHPEGPLVLRDVSFKTNPGEFIAFVGPSGSGKSTTLRLLLGFEKPETGAVYYDGQDLATVDITGVRAQMGVVLQNGRIMAGDIYHNIIGSAPLTVDDAWEAAQMAGMYDDIRSMPMGIHTILSEGGTTLSGGQRQRLLIARAIVHKPRILLFDEATSALDNRTQELVSESLEQIHATRIVVAHRLSTIRNADRIFVVDQGQIVEEGNYDDLVRQDGLFARLVKRQVA